MPRGSEVALARQAARTVATDPARAATPRASDVALARQAVRAATLDAQKTTRGATLGAPEHETTPDELPRGERIGRIGRLGRLGPNRSRARQRAVTSIGIALVLVLTSIGFAQPLAAQTTVTVPQIAGLAEADAINALAAAGIQVGARTTAYDGVVPAGVVISSDPPAGTVIDPAVTPVAYVVSLGPAPQTLQPTPSPTPKPTKPPHAAQAEANAVADAGGDQGHRRQPLEWRPELRHAPQQRHGVRLLQGVAGDRPPGRDVPAQRLGSARGRPHRGCLPLLRLHEGGQAAGQALPRHHRQHDRLRRSAPARRGRRDPEVARDAGPGQGQGPPPCAPR